MDTPLASWIRDEIRQKQRSLPTKLRYIIPMTPLRSHANLPGNGRSLASYDWVWQWISHNHYTWSDKLWPAHPEMIFGAVLHRMCDRQFNLRLVIDHLPPYEVLLWAPKLIKVPPHIVASADLIFCFNRKSYSRSGITILFDILSVWSQILPSSLLLEIKLRIAGGLHRSLPRVFLVLGGMNGRKI